MDLPKQVFVRFDPNNKGDENFLNVSAHAEDLAEQDELVNAGKYKLVADVCITNETTSVEKVL